ncbi:hypothetical protein MLD38_019774 [Melastoma candidum]|uniref:Uncharacterized protein n=1 Tax=Melastoma candidum TaxID=119954 RepID=A0ACB9R1L6_9MYRT|nr:hypothetical protein MLD38_019774 [Melastoma candidum]
MMSTTREDGVGDVPGGTPRAVINERVYVAVGSDVEESRLTLNWALENFDGNFRIIHVHRPSPPPPSSSGPGHHSGNSNHQEMERQRMHALLNEYVHMCNQAEVSAEKRYVETADIGKGIVELIEQHAITKLVMGAAADRHYNEAMTELQSTKAMFVNQHAHPSCYIWFICNGHLIFMREGNLETFDLDVTPSMLAPNPVVGAGQSVAGSPHNSIHSESDSSEVADDLALVRYERAGGSNHGTHSNTGNRASWNEDGMGGDKLYEQLQRAMTEAADAKREALQELLRRQNAEKAVFEATHRARSAENLYAEELNRRRDIEEMLSQEKEAVEMMKNQNSELQMLLENMLKANEEASSDQASEPSRLTRLQSISEFSFSEIQEAINNFDPSLKIDEGPCGSTYKGFLRNTNVTIKMLCSDSSEGPSLYHKEVEVTSKLRHPNLVSLMGVCPEAWALIYEHLPNGSLEERLSRDSNYRLPWLVRTRISLEICSALIFMHSSEPHGLVHGNLKPGNILLGVNFVSKLSDYGKVAVNSPHPIAEGETSFEADVYSFGAILLRLLTGRNALNLDEMVQTALDNNNLNAVLDASAGDWPIELAVQTAELALRCCDIDSRNRPNIKLEVWPLLEQMVSMCEASETTGPRAEEQNQVPQYFTCPIMHEIMEDPLVAGDGFTYEAEAIRGWLDQHDTSPMTNLPLPNLNLVPNRTLRSAIQEWHQNHPIPN